MNRLNGKVALITGATAGIGLETAHQLASMGVDLILTGRRADRLSAIQAEFSDTYTNISVKTYCFDVSDRIQVASFVESLGELVPDILVNNAGLAAGADKVYDASLDDWDIMIDTNFRGLIALTRLLVPKMMDRNSGHIMNVSSVAGHESYPGGSVYCATKHAVHAFTKSLKMDLGHTDIRVSLVSPGAVETEFSLVRFKGDTERASKVYEGMKKLVASDIAEIIVFILNRPEHVNILDTLVFSVSQSSATQIHRK
jgi:3-hydroxy acid dehydrogenase / malonic semialdehyde reductase